MLLLEIYWKVKKHIELLEYKKLQYSNLWYMERRELEQEIDTEKMYKKCLEQDLSDWKMFL